MKLALKLALIGGLMLLLGLPLAMLRGLVQERQQRAQDVAADIARSSSGAQRLVGPLLRVGIERQRRRVRMVGQGGEMRSEADIVTEREQRLLTPLRLDVEGALGGERRRRGLFKAIVYRADLELVADFAPIELQPDGDDVLGERVTAVTLVLGLGDARGVHEAHVQVDGREHLIEPGTGLAWLPAGLQVSLPPDTLQRESRVTMTLHLAGTDALHWIPGGDDSRVLVHGDWPHPSFTGALGPTHRDVGSARARTERAGPTHRDVGSARARTERAGSTHRDVGSAAGESAASVAAGADGRATGSGGATGAPAFSAEWKLSRLAAHAARAMRDCGAEQRHCAALDASGFGVRLVDPVDRYLKTDRAIKYAWLFIVLVLGALFFAEMLLPMRLHPLQYGLTGVALAVFFLLLLSLSEHIGFGPAYLLAASACVALVSGYVRSCFVLRGPWLGFSGLLAALYALLYGLIRSEDYALLAGSLALFALLASAMLLTRRVDWYRMGEDPTPPASDAEQLQSA